MYGLPTLRQKTAVTFPVLCYDSSGNPIDPPCGDTVRLATPLAEMRGNHFTAGVALDWRNLIAWGLTNYVADTLATGGSDNYPRKCNVDRAMDPILKMKETSRIIKFRSFAAYSFFLTEKGYLYASGSTADGIFNTGSSETRGQFRLVTDNVKAFDLCSSSTYGDGGHYILIVKTDGRLYGMGGQYAGFGLGDKDTGPFHSLKYLELTNIVNVFCNDPGNKGRSYAIDEDGCVWACGYNDYGCLGVNSKDAIVYDWTKVQKYDSAGNIVDLDNVKLVIPSNFVISGGAIGSGTAWSESPHANTFFLTNDGNVYTAGNNNYGQLGLGLATDKTVSVATKVAVSNVIKMASACGGLSIMTSTSENNIYSWGNNVWGQLGHGDSNNRNSPVMVATAPTDLIIDINGGGHYGVINGVFVVLTSVGDVYGAGFDETYALGIVDGSGNPVAANVTTLTKNPFFGPNPSLYINPSDTSARYLAIGVDLCGYGTEVAQKVVIKDGTLLMSGWNQNVGGIWNFNPKIGVQNVYKPSKYVLI